MLAELSLSVLVMRSVKYSSSDCPSVRLSARHVYEPVWLVRCSTVRSLGGGMAGAAAASSEH